MNIKNKINKKYFEISMYVIFTCVVIFVLSRVADNAGNIISAIRTGISWTAVVLKPVVAGFIIAYLLFPLLERIEALLRKIKFVNKLKGLRGIAVALLWLLIAAFIFIIVSLLISALTRQLTAASVNGIADALSNYANSINKFYKDLMASLETLNINSVGIESGIDQVVKNLGNYLLELSKGIGGIVDSIKDGLITTVFAVIFGIYFLLDGPSLTKYWGRIFTIILPEKRRKMLSVLIEDADRVFSGYIRGQLTDAFLLAVVMSIALSLVGIQYALVIALLMGIGNLVPYLSSLLGYSSTIIVSFVTGDFKTMVIALVVIFIILTVDGNVINPKLLSQSVNIHPMVVIIALIIGGNIAGFVGMVVAVPFGALIKLWFERAMGMAEKQKKKISAAMENDKGK